MLFLSKHRKARVYLGIYCYSCYEILNIQVFAYVFLSLILIRIEPPCSESSLSILSALHDFLNDFPRLIFMINKS